MFATKPNYSTATRVSDCEHYQLDMQFLASRNLLRKLAGLAALGAPRD